MITITININIENHKDILEKNKGKAVASLFGTSDIVKAQVEGEVKKVIVSSLKNAISDGLKENEIIGNINII
ncbi:hypothetical protein [Clostridium fallax]|uniref:Uncharacterized protein n=1 Tax=Clostridium fallax TaxID=1533 RepID=A0A1M4U5J5_9CLOT|nr:hypothetical protein [Clostridium fallax]SHE51948.1 hypothetical protein SAMN05443638_10445 [Clostridium fallax]SQB06088.1 Uncharacterised protein [Clostridium fallax]